jgi:hypothetical protein
MKNSNDTIENRIRDLPACSVVPQPTAPPRAPPAYMVRPYSENGRRKIIQNSTEVDAETKKEHEEDRRKT